MTPDDLKVPVAIDRDRMDKALAGPFYTLPEGLTAEQISAVLKLVGEITRQAVDAEREACATMMLDTKEWHGESWRCTICPITRRVIAASIRARKDSA